MLLRGNDTHVPFYHVLQKLITFYFSSESTFPPGEGRLAETSLSIYKWKQNVSSESSLFVTTLVTVNCSTTVTSGNLYTFRFKWKVLFVADGSWRNSFLGILLNSFMFCFCFFKLAWDARKSKVTVGCFPPSPSFLPLFPWSKQFPKSCTSVMLAGCDPFQSWEDERQHAAGEGGRASCFESCFALGAGGKLQSSPFGKGRLGSAPTPHALSIFSFIHRRRQSSFLFLSLFVTLFWGSFSTALRVWQPWPQAFWDTGLSAHNIFLLWEVKPGIVPRGFFPQPEVATLFFSFYF